MYNSCLKGKSSSAAPDDDSGILADVATLCVGVRFTLFFEPRRSLRQRLPRLGQLAFPSKLLRRFLRGFFVATGRSLVTPPASVFHLVHARTKSRWIDSIFVRVMSGFVARAEVRRQAARCARA